MNQSTPWSDRSAPEGGAHVPAPGGGPNGHGTAGAGARSGNTGLIIGLSAAVAVLLVALVVAGFVAFGGGGAKSFTAKGIIQDHSGHMYDRAESPVADILGGNQTGMQCAGGDIDERSVLTIADSNGEIVATGGFTFEPSMSSEGDDGLFGSLSSHCGFSFEIPDVESDADYFQLSVSNMPDSMPPIDRQTLIDGAEISVSDAY